MKRRLEFIAEKKGHHTITATRRVVGVSNGTWYRWQGGVTRRTEKAAEEEQLLAVIREIWHGSKERYGLPKIHEKLRDRGILTSRKRVHRLMRQAGIFSHAHRRRIRTTIPGATDLPDLVKQKFMAMAVDRVWWTDITYIWTDEGWLYFAPIEDAFSRKVVGWAFADNLRTELPLAALKVAIRKRKPAPGLIHHSDRGCQYTSWRYQAALTKAGMLASMGKTGVCYDNAAAESFFSLLKKEVIYRRERWATRKQVIRAITAYIRWFNSDRIHSTLGMVSPDDFEAQNTAQAA